MREFICDVEFTPKHKTYHIYTEYWNKILTLNIIGLQVEYYISFYVTYYEQWSFMVVYSFSHWHNSNTFVLCCCYVTLFPLITVIIVIRCQFTFEGMFVLKMMFVYCRISWCNAVSRVAGKGEGWYIIMAVFLDILYKTSDRACCYHRLLLILCNESTGVQWLSPFTTVYHSNKCRST